MAAVIDRPQNEDLKPTPFLGVANLEAGAKIIAIVADGVRCDRIAEGQRGRLVIDGTPFYGAMPGRAGDAGMIDGPAGARVHVREAVRDERAVVWLEALPLSGAVHVGDKVRCHVDPARRRALNAHQSSLHLLTGALRREFPRIQFLHAEVGPDCLRLEFRPNAQPRAESFQRVEEIVERKILRNAPVLLEEGIPHDEARRRAGYYELPEATPHRDGTVTLVSMGWPEPDDATQVAYFDVQPTRGWHVERTGDIGPFVITERHATPEGTWIIEACAGPRAFSYVTETRDLLERVSGLLGVPIPQIKPRLLDLLRRAGERPGGGAAEAAATTSLGGEGAVSPDEAIAREFVYVRGVRVHTQVREGAAASELPATARNLAQQLEGPCFVLLVATGADGRVHVVGAASDSVRERLHADAVVADLARRIGGHGHGNHSVATGEGPGVAELTAMLNAVPRVVSRWLGH